MAKGETITIRDVALLAETSPSTISNLLNGRLERMRPETVERIRSAIEQLGYRPSEIARQLKSGQAPIIGLIIPSVANPFWGAFAQYVEEAALARGYQVLLCNGDRDPDREERYADALWSHGVRGVIFGSSPLSLDHVLRLVERGMHAVAFDRHTRTGDPGAIDSISVDNVRGARLAVDHLLALGHRRVGFLSGPLRTVSRLERLAGYRAALAEGGVEPEPALVWEGDPGRGFGDVEGAEFGRRGARDLLGGADPPTAIFANNDMYALGAYAGARDLGRRLPDDVSIVGFDDIAMAEIAEPPLTTVRQPLAEMLENAVRVLVGRLEETHAEPPRHESVMPELVVRASTVAPSRRHRRGTPRRAADEEAPARREDAKDAAGLAHVAGR